MLRTTRHGLTEVERAEIGLVFEQPMDGVYDQRWDPVPDVADEYLTDPSGLTGEDAEGVWASVHPDVLLQREPKLWGVVDAWAFGVRDITREDLEQLSAFEVSALLTLQSARDREERRYLKRLGQGGGDGDA